jgi:hypothetical protein
VLKPPFTTEDFLSVVGEAFSLPENFVGERNKTRASSLGSCARQQGYMMAGVEHDPIGVEGSARQTDQELTAEQGRMFEDLSVSILATMGFEVIDRQISLPDDYPVTGHPDGALGNIDGLFWGFEHKHLGRWAYEAVLKDGLLAAEPGYVLQAGLYGDALGWDAAQFVIVAQDSSSVRGDITANLRARSPARRWSVFPGIHPKVNIIPVDLRPIKHGLVPVALERAEWLSKWKQADGDPAHIAREANPDLRQEKWVADGQGGREQVEQAPFPCGWCPFFSRCLEDGPGGLTAPQLPWTETVEADD